MPKRPNFILLTILLIAFALRLLALLKYGDFWADELFCITYSQRPWLASWQFWTWETNPPLFMILLKFWFYFFPVTEFFARLLSTLFSLGSIYLIYLFARKHFNTNVAIASALGLSLVSSYFFFSITCRAYSLLMFLVILSTHLFFKIWFSNEKRCTRWYVVIQTLLLYSHLTAILAFASQFLLLLVNGRRDKGAIKLWLRLNIIPVCLWLIWAIPSLATKVNARMFSNSWFLNINQNTADTIKTAGSILIGNGPWLFVLIYIFIYLCALIICLYRQKNKGEVDKKLLSVVTLSIIPLVAAAVLNLWNIKFLFVALPWTLIVAAYLLDYFLKNTIACIFIVLALLLPADYLIWQSVLPINDWRGANQYIREHTNPDRNQLFIFTDFVLKDEVNRYYRERVKSIPYYPEFDESNWDYYLITRNYLFAYRSDEEMEMWLRLVKASQYDDIFILQTHQAGVVFIDLGRILKKWGWKLEEAPATMPLLGAPYFLYYSK